jgi:two-component system, cell cycle sensor histidine kinase and response regulator CckA
VDDEELVRKLAKATLSQAGHQVLEAGDGVEALKAYRDHNGEIDLVLLDLSMPKMDGEETFRELRRLDEKVCVILSSGYNEQDAIDHFSGKGLAGFIQKPYMPRTLLDAVQDILAKAGK